MQPFHVVFPTIPAPSLKKDHSSWTTDIETVSAQTSRQHRHLRSRHPYSRRPLAQDTSANTLPPALHLTLDLPQQAFLKQTITITSTGTITTLTPPPLPAAVGPPPAGPLPRAATMSLTPLPHANKTLYTTASPFEAGFGYHRALRRGPHILVSGTTAISPTTQTLQAPGDAYGQTVAAFAESLAAVAALGGSKADVLRVRMYVSRREDCDAVGRGFRETFGQKGEKDQEGVGCVATMIVLGAEGGGGFVDPEMLVEVEVDAFVL